MRASSLLYLVLAFQPALTAMMLALTVVFYATPVGPGFGFVSILSGLGRDDVDMQGFQAV